jgi:lipopolysaccharide export system protein LptC
MNRYEVGGTMLFTQPELVLYDRERTKGHGTCKQAAAYSVHETKRA